MKKVKTEKVVRKYAPGVAKRMKNLKPWVKGQSGNPEKKNMTGRPRIADYLNAWGKLKVAKKIISQFTKLFPDVDLSDMDADHAWTLKVMAAAIAGQPWAVEFMSERREGKVKQQLQMSGKMGMELHDLTSDELDRRIKDLETRETPLVSGAPTAPGA